MRNPFKRPSIDLEALSRTYHVCLDGVPNGECPRCVGDRMYELVSDVARIMNGRGLLTQTTPDYVYRNVWRQKNPVRDAILVKHGIVR